MLRRAIALALFAAALAPASAQALTTTVSHSSQTVAVRVSGEGTNDFRNAVVVTQDSSNNIVVTDGGQEVDAVVAIQPCFQMSVNSVACPLPVTGKDVLEITTGGGPDSIEVNLPPQDQSSIGPRLLFGGPGDDVIVGSSGEDTIHGDGRNGDGSLVTPQTSGGDDVLVGRGGADTINGGPRDDYLAGGEVDVATTDPETLDGGAGSDVFDVGMTLGPDVVIGGPDGADGLLSLETFTGDYDIEYGDVVAYRSRTFATAGTAGVTVDLDGVADDGAAGEGDRVDSTVESIYGTVRDDTLNGSTDGNLLEGSAGVDTVRGKGGSDEFRLRDSVRDRCTDAGTGDLLDLDLVDPTPLECSPTTPVSRVPPSLVVNIRPVDETMPPVEIARQVSATARSAVVARVACAEDAPRACSGTLALQAEARGRRVARTRYRIRPGRSARVALDPGAARRRALAGKVALLTATGPGLSRRGDSTVIAARRVPR